MKYRESAVIEALVRVLLFLDSHRDLFAKDDPVQFDRVYRRLEETLTSLRAFAVEQDGGRRGSLGETSLQTRLRLDLRAQWLRPIATIARRNAKRNPGLKALDMPRASTRGEAFLASAR